MAHRGLIVNDPLMISALEHYAYCPRQCALIHMEQVFDENVFTLRGQRNHQRVDDPGEESHYGVRVERAMPLWSKRYNLIGKADLVEFQGDTPYPVEYKSGSRRRGEPEKIQLCAQALCLEEMLGVVVEKGALFWYASRQRQEVIFDEKLRAKTVETIAQTRQMLESGKMPPPVMDHRCRHCSLIEACMPEIARETESFESLFEVDNETDA